METQKWLVVIVGYNLTERRFDRLKKTIWVWNVTNEVEARIGHLLPLEKYTGIHILRTEL